MAITYWTSSALPLSYKAANIQRFPLNPENFKKKSGYGIMPDREVPANFSVQKENFQTLSLFSKLRSSGPVIIGSAVARRRSRPVWLALLKILAPRLIDFPSHWRKQLPEQDRRFLFSRDKKGRLPRYIHPSRGSSKRNSYLLDEVEKASPRNRYDFAAFYMWRKG